MALLPEPLPDSPLALFRTWFEEAHEANVTDNPNAMVLATVDTATDPPQPDARVVLCKALDDRLGVLTFYTNFDSRKGRELARTPRACAVFHWDAMERQVRIEGPALRAPDADSDAYFASRHAGSRVGAWASDQSRPLASRQALLARVAEQAARFGVPLRDGLEAESVDVDIPRPPHWGGYRLWIAALELWSGGAHRVHDRARWTRTVTAPADGGDVTLGPWQCTRLQP